MKTAGLKLNIQKIKIMAFWSHDFMANRWGKVETVTDFMFLGSKIPADSDCSHGIRCRLLLGRKAVTNLERVLKSRDISLLTQVCIVKAMVFTVVMHGCELDHKEA